MDARFEALALDMELEDVDREIATEEDLLDRAMAAANRVLAEGGDHMVVSRLDTLEAPADFRPESCRYRTVCEWVVVCEDGVCRRQRRCWRECIP